MPRIERSPSRYFRFCPRCGAALKIAKSDGHPNLVCTRRDFVFYQNPHTAVSALVFDARNRVLLVKRRDEPKKGTWDVPGGFVSWGENPETGIIREMREELRARFKPQRLLGIYPDWYDFRGLRYSVYNVYYLGTLTGHPRAASDVAGIRWFPLNRLPRAIAFPHIRRALRDISSGQWTVNS